MILNFATLFSCSRSKLFRARPATSPAFLGVTAGIGALCRCHATREAGLAGLTGVDRLPHRAGRRRGRNDARMIEAKGSARMSLLEDKDAIREVMAAYCHALDAGRFADVANLFADDGIWTTDYGEAKGRAAIERMLRSIVPVKGEGPQRKHYITNIIITVDGNSAVSVSDYLVVRES